jgi:3-methylcrotonyl-CoA carboxylase alpha subunit
MKNKALKVGKKIWVQFQGRIYGISPKAAGARGGEDEAQELAAPFSCKVLKVHTKAGASLKKGDPVIVVEAMKMEYSFSSPKDGVVDEVLVKVGEVLPEGTQFIRWRNA